MRVVTCFCVLLSLFAAALPAAADDQKKAEAQANKITAMTADLTARRIVSIAMSDMLDVKRPELVQGGVKMDDIAMQLKAGKTIWQIGDDLNADWSEIQHQAKKLNGKIGDC